MLGKTHLYDFKYGLLNKEILNHPEVRSVGQLRADRHERLFGVAAYC